MSLDTYANLQTAGGNWTGRSDLTSRLPEFISLAEAKINRKLRTKDMETKNASFSITGEYVATPTGFGGVRSFYLNTSPIKNLEFMASDTMTSQFAGVTKSPSYYSIVGSNFRFGAVPDGTYSATLIYFLQVPVLSGSNTTNWLLTSHPDAYLYGMNAEASGFQGDWSTQQAWEAKLYRVLDEIVEISNRDKWGGNSMAVRLG